MPDLAVTTFRISKVARSCVSQDVINPWFDTRS